MIIAGSRLIALSMMTVDLMILGRFSLNETADFALAAQYSQIYIVLAMGLTVGVNIVFNVGKRRSEPVSAAIVGYAVFAGVVLCGLSIVMSCWLDMSANSRLAYYVLAVGIAPTTVFIAVSAMVEASGGSRWVFNLTAAAALANVMLDYLFIHIGLGSPAVAVAAATTLIRLVLLAILIVVFARSYRFSLVPTFNAADWKGLFSYGRSEAFVAVVFTGGISVLFAYTRALTNEDILARLAVGVNFLNIASVTYLGMTRAIANVASEHLQHLTASLKALVVFGVGYVAACSVALYAAKPLLSWVYLGRMEPELIQVFAVAVWVVAFDGLAMLFITLLRLLDWRTGPPLLRLLMIVIGLPLSMAWFDPANIQPVFSGLLIGNLLAAVLSALLLRHAVVRRRPADCATGRRGV